MPNFKNKTLLDKQQQLWPYMMDWRIRNNKCHSCGVYGCGAGDENGNLYSMANADGICQLVRCVRTFWWFFILRHFVCALFGFDFW